MLEEFLHARRDCFSFLPSSFPLKNAIYRRPAIYLGNDLYDVALVSTAGQLLLRQTVDVLVETLQNFTYSSENEYWFYDYTKKKNHSPESLARLIYEEVYNSLYEFFGGALGIDFSVMSRLSEMAYEKDAAHGHLFFYTGTVSHECLNRWCKPLFYQEYYVTLTSENVRHIRKLLAGTEKNGLLFIRDTDADEYRCYGYIDQECRMKIFTSIFIDGKGGWRLMLDGKETFCVKGNRAFLPPSLFEFEDVQKKLESEFGAEYSELLPALEVLSTQKHGTSIVFLDLDKENSFSAEWMTNLANRKRACAVTPISLKEVVPNSEAAVLLNGISRVDGAIVADYPSREIRYINVIVDGKAVTDGRADVGSRHNALRSFVANLAKGGQRDPHPKALACIFSEDGGISVEAASSYYEEINK